MSFTVPVDPRSVLVAAQETGKEMRVHDATVLLKSVLGNVATLRFRGASEHMLLVRGYGADDKVLAVEGRSMLPAKRDVDDDFSITFKGPPVKRQIKSRPRSSERVFPFSAVRGTVAGRSARRRRVTLPPRTRAAQATQQLQRYLRLPAPAPPAAAQSKSEGSKTSEQGGAKAGAEAGTEWNEARRRPSPSSPRPRRRASPPSLPPAACGPPPRRAARPSASPMRAASTTGETRGNRALPQVSRR